MLKSSRNSSPNRAVVPNSNNKCVANNANKRSASPPIINREEDENRAGNNNIYCCPNQSNNNLSSYCATAAAYDTISYGYHHHPGSSLVPVWVGYENHGGGPHQGGVQPNLQHLEPISTSPGSNSVHQSGILSGEG